MVDFRLGAQNGGDSGVAQEEDRQPESLVCSGPVSNLSYDSHIVTRRRMADEYTRTDDEDSMRYNKEDMDLEIQRVARELYKALNSITDEFDKLQDLIAIDDLTTHTDTARQEMIHPYKTLYGRDLNQVLRDNLGDDWDEACATLMTEMRMYELECLRRRMEDVAEGGHDKASLLGSHRSSSIKSGVSSKSGRRMKLEDMIDEATKHKEEFTGHSCLLVTWKTNPEVEQFKELYIGKDTCIKTHKRKGKPLVDPGDLVSDKSLSKVYKILGKGEGRERLLVKNESKKKPIDEIDGDDFKYFLLAGTNHPYPEDTFYSVGRVPRKLLLKYLGIKMYLVRLKKKSEEGKVVNWKTCAEIAELAMGPANIAR